MLSKTFGAGRRTVLTLLLMFAPASAQDYEEIELVTVADPDGFNAVEAAYRRGDQVEKRRQMMEAWAQFLLGKSAASVVEFGARHG